MQHVRQTLIRVDFLSQNFKWKFAKGKTKVTWQRSELDVVATLIAMAMMLLSNHLYKVVHFSG